MMDSTPEQKPPKLNGGDPRYGTRRSSIPFVVEFDSDEEDEPAWDHPDKQAESGGESSEDHQPPAVEKSPQTPQTPQRSMRRISQISVGSDFADMAQNLDESDHNAKPKPPPFSGHHYVIPLGGLESPNQKKEKGNGSNHSRSGSNHRRSGSDHSRGGSSHRRTGSDHSRGGSNHSRSGGRQNRQLSDSLCDVMIPPQTTLKQSQSLPMSSLQLAASKSRISSSFLESKGSRGTDIYESTIQARLSRARSASSSSSDESQTRRSRSNSSGSSKDPSSPKATYQSSLQARLSELKAQQASAEDVLRQSHRDGNARRSASKRETGRSISPIRVNPAQQPLQRSNSFTVPTHHQRRRAGHYADRLKLAKQIGGAILNGDSLALEDSLHSKRSSTSEMNGNKGSFDDLGTSEHTTGDSVVEPKDNSLPEAAAAAAQTRAKLRKKHSERKDRLHRVLVKMNSAAILKSLPQAAKERSPSMSPIRELSQTRELPTSELEDTLLQPTVDDVSLNTSFHIGESGAFFTPGQPQEDLNVKCPGKVASRDENEVAPPASPKRFPSTVQNVGVAAMPIAGFRRTKGSMLDDDDESVGLSTIADNSVDFDTLATKSEHSTTLDAVMKESSNLEGSSAALTTTTTLKSVASDVLLDPAKFLRRHSSTVSSSASVQTPSDEVSALTHATGLTNAQKIERRPSLISVEETNPEEDAKTAATPFFGAALRHLQTMTSGTSDHSRISYGSDPEEGSVASFAGSSFAEEDCSITSEYVASKMAGKRRGSMLGAIYEGNSGNMSLENSHTPSEALDMFEDANINPLERKLIAQRDEMFVGRRDSMLSTTSTNSSTNSRVPRKTARRMSMGVAAPLRRNDNYQIQGRVSAETGNLDNVELDHTIPPESTRTRQARRSTAGHSIASDYSHIETTTLEMANMSMAVAKIKKFSKRKRSSVKSAGSESKGRRGTRDAIDLGAFEEFKLNRSSNGDDDGLISCASSVESFIAQPKKLPSQRAHSMYHYKGGNLSSEEKNEQHDRNWKALLQGHGVMLQNTGERPVLRRMYIYAAFIVCIGICLVIPLVILKGWVREDENPYPEESVCRRPDLADSLQRCTCNSTSTYTWDESVQSRYEDLTFLLLDQGVLNEENIPEDVESCSNENVAILWISEGDWDFYTIDVDRTVQRYVMGYFFLELGGTLWTESTLWMSESDVCDWLGLSCSGMGLTTSLHLTDNNLEGSIPSELSYISYLTQLRLDQNDNIAGTLPTTLSTLSHLYEIDLSGNGLSGNLFTGVFLGSSDSLEVLNISSNGLEGTIPRGFALLSKLQQLDLSSNTMGGSLPLSLGALGELRGLVLANNKFDGELPRSLLNLTSLELMDLSGNPFTGSVPDGLCESLPFLQEFSVTCTDLETDGCQCCSCDQGAS